ncbi:hypothetical protein ACFWPA_11205 [Rhodococcus sp. NPDC058505]|uniref:hypothetical protein n=1 Tax=unclassified Rhodococcus (in: high G+C Gram-positive bacteria) TaxID=192944 RepID=UPI003647ABAA
MAPRTPGTDSPASTPSGGGLLFRTAMVLFFAGLIAVVAIFVIAATGHTPGLALYLLALLCPIGFLCGIGAALLAGRRTRGGEH